MYEFGRWGLQVSDYCDIFDLSTSQLETNVLEYGCGPTAVNAELHAATNLMVSCDALFEFNKNKICAEINAYIEQMKQSSLDEAWITHKQQAFTQFLADYELGKKEERYLAVSNHQLPFADFTFDLALNAYGIFDALDVTNCTTIIIELARVAKEVRIFPLMDKAGQPSAVLGPVLLMLQQNNYGVEIREVVDHMHPENKAMLRVWALQCPVFSG